MQWLIAALAFSSLALVALADVVDIQKLEPDPPPVPYSFKYRAGRFPGQVDRQHEETKDSAGVIRGSFSYVDPGQKVRTVEYVADQNGFHPLVHNPVQDTPTVSAAKARHSELFQKIAYEHAQIAAEQEALRAAQVLEVSNLNQVARADVVDIQKLEPDPPPVPYSFKYSAGRFPGHVDRQHEETKDSAGVIRGSFSFVGPRQRVRTVEYVADQNGFQPIVHNPVQDTPSVSVAKARHSELFEKIAYEHAQIGAEREALRAAQGYLEQAPPEY